jgi:hypothetical protein
VRYGVPWEKSSIVPSLAMSSYPSGQRISRRPAELKADVVETERLEHETVQLVSGRLLRRTLDDLAEQDVVGVRVAPSPCRVGMSDIADRAASRSPGAFRGSQTEASSRSNRAGRMDRGNPWSPMSHPLCRRSRLDRGATARDGRARRQALPS